MKKIALYLIIIITFTKCDLWDVYDVNFVDVESSEIIKYEINITNNNFITDYKRFINDKFIDSTVFYVDTVKVERITYNADGEIAIKKIFYLGEDALASTSIDSNYYSDSTYVILCEYSYGNKFLSRKHITSNTTNGVTELDIIYRYVYGDSNIVKRDVTIGTKKCTDEFTNSDYPYLIDIEDFSNGFIGLDNNNLVSEIFWQSSCNRDENVAVSATKFTYEFNDNGYVIKKTERFTPEYNTSLESNVVRYSTSIIYEYNFK